MEATHSKSSLPQVCYAGVNTHDGGLLLWAFSPPWQHPQDARSYGIINCKEK